MAESYNRAVKRGIGWVAAERLALQTLNLATTVVLARILMPQDYGIMGIVVFFTDLATTLVSFGFGMALIQRESITEDHLSAMFLMTLGINSVLWIGLTLTSPLIGAHFGQPLVGKVLALMATNFLIRVLGTCPYSILRRRMDFRPITIGSILDQVVRLGVAVILGFRGYGVWSLAWGELAGALTEKIFLIWASGWRPRFRTTRSAINDLFGYGLGISFKSSLIYLTENGDNYVVGKWLGPAALGFYEKAYNLMNLPVRELGARATTVLFPVFSRIHQEVGRFRLAYRKTMLSLSLVSYPVFVSLVVLAPQIIQIVYGPRWISTVLPFQILCIAGLPRMLTQIASSVINAVGSVGPEVKRRGVILVLLLGGAMVGSRWGIVGVATAVTLVNVVSALVILILLVRVCPITPGDIFRPQWIPFAGAVALAAAERTTQFITSDHLSLGPFPVFALSSVGGTIAYAAVVLMLRDETLNALAREIWADLRPFRQGVARRLRGGLL